MAVEQITGTDVIGTPGQNLDRRELRYVVGLADGETSGELAQACSVRPEELPFIEASIRMKIGARTKTHMLTRAFSLGILRARALLAVGVLSVVGLSSLLYYHQHHIPQAELDPWHYDVMAGGSAGPVLQDPHYVELIMRRYRHSS